MYFTAKSGELKKFREAKNLSQTEIAEMLNMEQTTYSKKERGKSSISYLTALAISKIIDKKIEDFAENTSIVNNVIDSTMNNSSVSGDIVYNNYTTSLPDKMIQTLEDLISLIKENYKKAG